VQPSLLQQRARALVLEQIVGVQQCEVRLGLAGYDVNANNCKLAAPQLVLEQTSFYLPRRSSI
jgi:hypothetical protein